MASKNILKDERKDSLMNMVIDCYNYDYKQYNHMDYGKKKFFYYRNKLS